MIPKIIHYCWFGQSKKPDLVIKCIESWKKYCQDYKTKEWNESNFDINFYRYVKEAYQSKKWSFVTDFVRLYALVTEGGIYMDTDVEVVKPFDDFLTEQAFSGFERADAIPTGIMACEKGFGLFQELLSDYDNRTFIKEDGNFDMTTNCIAITEHCKKCGLKLNNEKQTIKGFTLYPKDVFCPKNNITGKIELTDNTRTIHHFTGSWQSPKEKFKAKVKGLVGPQITELIINIKKKLKS